MDQGYSVRVCNLDSHDHVMNSFLLAKLDRLEQGICGISVFIHPIVTTELLNYAGYVVRTPFRSARIQRQCLGKAEWLIVSLTNSSYHNLQLIRVFKSIKAPTSTLFQFPVEYEESPEPQLDRLGC